MKTQIRYRLLIWTGLQVAFLSACHRPVLHEQSQSNSAASVVRVRDVVYGRKFGTALTMDVLKPAKPNGIGVVFLLSGGWHSDFSMIEKRLKHFHYFTDRGQTVFLVLHGSAPRYQVHEVVQDVHRAVRFIRYHAADYSVDPNRLGISGMSSGGHLSISVGTGVGQLLLTDTIKTTASVDPVDLVSSRVQAVACFFPPTDLVNYGNAGRLFVESDTTKRYWPQFGVAGKTREEKLKLMQALSPIRAISADTPPTLLLHGTVDPIVPLEQSQRFVAALKAVGVSAQLIIHQGGAHGWDETWESDLGVLANWFEKYLPVNGK